MACGQPGENPYRVLDELAREAMAALLRRLPAELDFDDIDDALNELASVAWDAAEAMLRERRKRHLDALGDGFDESAVVDDPRHFEAALRRMESKEATTL